MLIAQVTSLAIIMHVGDTYHFVTGENFHYTYYTLSRELIAYNDRKDNLQCQID